MKSLIAAFCLLATPAFAWPITPPERVDHPFYDSAKLFVDVEDYWKVREICRNSWDIPRGGYADACTWSFQMADGSLACHMVMPRLSDDPSDVEIDWYVAVLRQETAECNNEAYTHVWLGGYSDARF